MFLFNFPLCRYNQIYHDIWFQWFTYCDSFPFVGSWISTIVLSFNDQKRRGGLIWAQGGMAFRKGSIHDFDDVFFGLVTNGSNGHCFLTPVQHMDLAIFFGSKSLLQASIIFGSWQLCSPRHCCQAHCAMAISLWPLRLLSVAKLFVVSCCPVERWQILRESSVMTFAVLELKHRRGAA